MPGMSSSTQPRRAWHQHALPRLLWCALGVFLCLGLTLWLVGPWKSPFLMASLGSSSVFLFALTQAQAGQPRALVGGHLITAAVGGKESSA